MNNANESCETSGVHNGQTHAPYIHTSQAHFWVKMK